MEILNDDTKSWTHGVSIGTIHVCLCHTTHDSIFVPLTLRVVSSLWIIFEPLSPFVRSSSSMILTGDSF